MKTNKASCSLNLRDNLTMYIFEYLGVLLLLLLLFLFLNMRDNLLDYLFQYLATTQGSVRLSGGSSSSGRVEIYHNGQWGTVCDDYWDLRDAHVVCRQLGFQKALHAYTGATHGLGTGPIWMHDLSCSGCESNLYECRHDGWGNHACSHHEDASVLCSYDYPVVRLVGGGCHYGRVEICENGYWGTVCDDYWDINDANVACRHLGFSGATLAPTSAAYGQGYGPILRDHIKCSGNEASLLHCPYEQIGTNHCSHSEDASVICY